MGRKITIRYGLITVAAKAEKAVEAPMSFNNVCVGQPIEPTGTVTLRKSKHDPRPVRQPSICETCGPITDRTVLKKGLKSGDNYIVVDTSDLGEAKEAYAGEYKGAITVVPHPSAQFLTATAPGDSLNYLVPDAASADHYQLLVKLVESHPELSFVGLHTPQSATSVFRLTVREGVLVLEKRVREQSMAPVPSVGGAVNEQLYGMLEATLSSFTAPYEPDAYEDRYQVAVQEILEAGQVVAASAKAEVATASTDDALIAQLQALAAQS